MVWTEIIELALVVILLYVYLGYPVLLRLAARLFGRGSRFEPGHQPTVTLVISAYNEEGVIRAKIENSLALDYPAEKLRVMVVSDCSSDGTDAVVRSFAERGVTLVRAPERRGKTAALNLALERIDTELVLFSDANAIYDSQAVRYLAGHFADPRVGYVVGHARYREDVSTAAGESEGAYWDLEVKIKEWESRLGSVVGGDGAIYAIRRSLYQPMQETDINDFVNPLQIVAQGYRGLFEPRAWCVESPAGEFGKEFSRKVRIANRSFNAVLRVPQTLNPLRVGLFAWELLSHKVLRWFSPFFLLALLAVTLLDRAVGPMDLLDQLSGLCWLALFALALAGWLFGARKGHPLVSLPYYFVLMNLASALGIWQRLRGRKISTWTTVRQEGSAGGLLSPGLFCYLVPGALPFGACWYLGGAAGAGLAATLLVAALLHAYLGYPVLLAFLRRLAPVRIERDQGHLPGVTLLICAYNEEREIAEKLENSLRLDYPREKLQIVVASDGSSDATNAIVAGFQERGVSLLAFPRNRGKIAALRDAMEQISSEIVVLSDANVAYQPEVLLKLVRNFADPRVGVVSGKVVLVNDGLSYGKAERSYYGVEHFIQSHEGALGTLIGADGAMYAIRRKLFRPPAPDTILDDLAIPMAIARGGHLVLHEPEALGYEVNRLELSGEFRRKARIIAGGYQFLLRGEQTPGPWQPLLFFCFFSHKVLRWTSGFQLLALLALLLRLQIAVPDTGYLFFTALLAALSATLLLALLVQFFPVLKAFRLYNYSHYFYMLMAASLLGCYLGLTGRQKVAWRGGTS